MTYQQRKERQDCTYPNCPEPPLEDNCRCERHRDEHNRQQNLSNLRAKLQPWLPGVR